MCFFSNPSLKHYWLCVYVDDVTLNLNDEDGASPAGQSLKLFIELVVHFVSDWFSHFTSMMSQMQRTPQKKSDMNLWFHWRKRYDVSLRSRG